MINEKPNKLDRLNKLEKEELAYIAGFLDGDGSIIAQIIKNKDYKYNFTYRLSINFYQKKERHWFILYLYKKLNKYGYYRIRNDNISMYTITGDIEVKKVLKALYPYLRIKKPQAREVLNIIDKRKSIKTKDDFLEVCKLIDKVSDFNDSKTKKINFMFVKNYFDMHL